MTELSEYEKSVIRLNREMGEVKTELRLQRWFFGGLFLSMGSLWLTALGMLLRVFGYI